MFGRMGGFGAGSLWRVVRWACDSETARRRAQIRGSRLSLAGRRCRVGMFEIRLVWLSVYVLLSCMYVPAWVAYLLLADRAAAMHITWSIVSPGGKYTPTPEHESWIQRCQYTSSGVFGPAI